MDWSAKVGRAVYASRRYLILAEGLTAKANTTLIATPSARFIRAFGEDSPNDGDPMLSSFGSGDQPNIRIVGGIWGPELKQRTPSGMTFTNPGPSGPYTVSFTGAKALLFDAGGNWLPNIAHRLWVYQRDDKGDYDPGVPNNNRIFTVLSAVNDTTLLLGEAPVATTTPITGMIASQVPLAGNAFQIESTGGVLDGVGLVYPRGIQFFLGGDGFLVTRCWSRDSTPDGGGGVRFNRGRGLRGTLLDLETSDDCFQFNVAHNATIERSSFVDCIGRTNQDALIAFLNGGGNTYGGADSDSQLRDCVALDICGVKGGSGPKRRRAADLLPARIDPMWLSFRYARGGVSDRQSLSSDALQIRSSMRAPSAAEGRTAALSYSAATCYHPSGSFTSSTPRPSAPIRAEGESCGELRARSAKGSLTRRFRGTFGASPAVVRAGIPASRSVEPRRSRHPARRHGPDPVAAPKPPAPAAPPAAPRGRSAPRPRSGRDDRSAGGR